MKEKFKGLIFVDMDDTIGSFVDHVHNTLNTPNHLRSDNLHGLPYKEQIPKIKNWWSDIPLKPGAQELMNVLKPYKPHILSAYANWDAENSKAHKIIWLKRHFPWIPAQRINLVKRHEKKFYALTGGKPNILIDDYGKNIMEWKAAGGIGIQHIGLQSTLAKLKELGIT